MKKGLFNCIIILLWGCLPPEREIVSIVRIENNTGFYLDSLWLGVHSFKGLADSEFTNYVEVIDGDIGIAALVFIAEEAKPTNGNDIIFAGAGDDIINATSGVDRLSGGDGVDTFVFSRDDGTSTIIDFSSSDGDQIDVSKFGFANWAELQPSLTASIGNNTLLTLDDDTFVYFDDIQYDEILVTDFIL